MSKRYQTIVTILFRMTDAAVIAAAWLLAYWTRFFLPPFEVTKGLPPFHAYASLLPFVALLWVAVFSFFGVYASGRMRSRRNEVLLLWKAHFVALFLFTALAYFYDECKYSRLVILYFGALGALALAIFRVSVRTALRHLRQRGYDLRRVLIVGGGSAVETLVQRFDWYPELGMRVVGVVTRDGLQSTASGKPVLGRFDEIRRLVDVARPDEVLIALPPSAHEDLNALLGILRDAMVGIRIVPDVLQYVTLGCHVEDFEGLPIIRLNDPSMSDAGALAKRVLDIAFSGLGLVLLAPLLLLIAALLKLTSPGPVLYAQERMGLDGKTFRMLKFRSMRVDAEAVSGAVWAKRRDDRRTPLGTILRKTSLDELPQLWNVLVGDMSLVGPRPERPVFVQQFRNEIPHYMLRHKVKAGITGWAQVNGWRGDTSLKERIACDLYYIRHWSLNLDLKILTLTLWRGFINRNAY